jgi:hypothetical protein
MVQQGGPARPEAGNRWEGCGATKCHSRRVLRKILWNPRRLEDCGVDLSRETSTTIARVPVEPVGVGAPMSFGGGERGTVFSAVPWIDDVPPEDASNGGGGGGGSVGPSGLGGLTFSISLSFGGAMW